MHDAFALSFRATAGDRVVLGVACCFVSWMRRRTLPDCISLDGLVESMVPARTDVVDQREQLPLAIHLGLAVQDEAVEPLVGAHVAEERLDERAMSVPLVRVGLLKQDRQRSFQRPR